MSLVGACEVQQVAHQSLHAVVGGEHVPRRGAPPGVIRMSEGNLQVGSHRGQWRLQLVRRVSDKTPPPVGPGLEPVEHRVHRRRQPADLVISRGHGHAPLE